MLFQKDKWQNKKTRKKIIKKFAETDDSKNLFFPGDCKISINPSKTRLNNNILILGDSEKDVPDPVFIENILSGAGSYIITDPGKVNYPSPKGNGLVTAQS